MSYRTFVEQRVYTFERPGGNGLGMKRLVTETSRGWNIMFAKINRREKLVVCSLYVMREES